MAVMETTRVVESRPWWHSIELGDGVVTPGQVPLHYLKKMLADLRFPESFEGLSVLDIGAWDGFFSFEAEKRGAARVVAYDLHPPDHHGFATAKRLLESNVEYVQGSVYDLSPEVLGTFDVVFFLGVFYHLRYPLLALDRIWDMVNQYALIETHHLDNCLLLPEGNSCKLSAIDPRLTDIALYQFYRDDELTPDDFSNWFAPNRRAIEDGLWSAGFQPEFLAAWGNRIAFKATKVPGIPEYRRETYDGLKWQVCPDGSQSPVVPLRDTGSAVRSLDGDRAERKNLRAEVIALRGELAAVKADWAARLDVIDAQGRELGGKLDRAEADRAARLRVIEAQGRELGGQLAAAEADRAARLRVIEAQGRRLGVVEEERNRLRAELSALQGQIGRTRAYRLLRRLGRWKFMEQRGGGSARSSSA